jgi:hypothetical protein
VLDRLVLAHLVTEDVSGRFGMHDLLRLFARDTSREVDDQATRDAAEARLVRYYADLARCWIPALTRGYARRWRRPPSEPGCRFSRRGRLWRSSRQSGPVCWPRSAWPHGGAGMSR